MAFVVQIQTFTYIYIHLQCIYNIIQYNIISYHMIYNIIYQIILYYIILYCVMLYYIYYIISYYIISYHIISYYIILYYILSVQYVYIYIYIFVYLCATCEKHAFDISLPSAPRGTGQCVLLFVVSTATSMVTGAMQLSSSLKLQLGVIRSLETGLLLQKHSNTLCNIYI